MAHMEVGLWLPGAESGEMLKGNFGVDRECSLGVVVIYVYVSSKLIKMHT